MIRMIGILCAAMLFSISSAQAIDIQRVVSPGGIEAWLVQEEEVPVIVMQVAWEGGSASDPADKEGLANLVSGLLDEGAGDLDSQTFQTKLEATAAKMSFSESQDHFLATFKTLAEKKDEAFPLFALAINQPRFDEEAVERIRAQIGVIIARNMDDPDWQAMNAWNQAAFGAHPYAREGDGTPQSIARITRDDLVSFTKNVFARGNMKIAVVGPVTPKELGALLDRTFGKLPAKANLPEVPSVKIADKKTLTVLKKPFPQSVVVFGQQGLLRKDDDFIPAFVMNYILGGGGFSSRLTEEVREKRGLAYTVQTFLYPQQQAGAFVGKFGTKNASAGLALSIIRKEMQRMRDSGVTAKELADAKTFLTGSYPLRFDSNEEIAGQLISLQIDDLGIDYVKKRNALVEAVTREDIARVAKRLLHPGSLTVAVVGEPDMSETEKPGEIKPSPEPAAGPTESAPQ